MTVLAGVHEQYQGTVDKTTPQGTLQRFPMTAVTREFNNGVITPQNLVPKLKNLCQEVWDAGLVPAVSFKLSVADVLNGGWKPYVESAGAWLADSGYADKTIFVLWHEPEDNVPKAFKDAKQFVTYFNLVHDWLKGVAPQVLTCHAATGYRYGDKNKGTKDKPHMVPIDIDDDTAKIWGQTKADIKCIDIYSGRSFPLGTILPELTAFKRWLANVVGTGTYGVTERGWMADTPAENQLRAQTVQREAEWLRDTPDGRRCVLYIAWLTRGTEDDATLKPDSKMASSVNYLLHQVNAPDPVPEPTPAPTPVTTVECPLCHGDGTVPSDQSFTIIKSA